MQMSPMSNGMDANGDGNSQFKDSYDLQQVWHFYHLKILNLSYFLSI